MRQRVKIAILWIARLLGLFHLGRIITRRGLWIVGWHGVSLDDEHMRVPNYFVSVDTLRKRLAHQQALRRSQLR